MSKNSRIFELRAEGKTYREISEEVGLSVNAIKKRVQRNKRKFGGASVSGATADQETDTDGLWSRAIAGQQEHAERVAQRRDQSVTVTTPCAIALLSDTHFGAPGTDYEAAKRDAEIIRDTPGMFAEFHGDGVDNWIVGKLQRLQRGQIVDFADEWELFLSWLDMLRGSLLWVVSGNHDNWTIALSGFDRVRLALQGTNVLYHTDQTIFNLHAGPLTYRVKVRHKWKGNSIFNPTHGIETSWERSGDAFDIGIGGHTHIATLYREFVKHQKKRFAILTGTYKLHDIFGEQIGFAPPHGNGGGALVFDRAGRFVWIDNLPQAAELLRLYQVTT